MIVHRIMTEEDSFDLPDDSYDYVCGLLERLNSNKQQPSPSPTVEISVFTAKFALEYLKKVVASGPVLDEIEQAIKEAEGVPVQSKAKTVEVSLEDAKKVYESIYSNVTWPLACSNLQQAISKAESKWWGTTEIEQFRESEKINFDNMSKKAGGLNVPSPAIQDQVNELRKKVDDVQTRLSEIASTVSRANLSQHIRLGGGEPNNL